MGGFFCDLYIVFPFKTCVLVSNESPCVLCVFWGLE